MKTLLHQYCQWHVPILFKIYSRCRRPERTSVSASPVQCWCQMVMRKLDVIIFTRNVRLTVLPSPLDIIVVIESSFMSWQHFVKPCTSLPCICLNFRLWLYKHTRYLFMIEFCHFLPGILSWCGGLTSAISLMPLLYGELEHNLILHLEQSGNWLAPLDHFIVQGMGRFTNRSSIVGIKL